MMQQLLINRFRGLFLSVAVLEAQLQGNSWSRLGATSTSGRDHHWQIPPEGLGWGKKIATSTQTLITTQVPPRVADFQDDDYSLARLIAKMLPIALFWHDNLPQLKQQVGEHLLKEVEPDLQAGMMGIGVAIALLCQEQANAKTLIPQLLTQKFLSGTDCQAHLRQVQALLKTHASLTTVWNRVSQDQSLPAQQFAAAMAMAMYCWSSTADSFPLTISRILALPQPSVLAVLIVSALSGVFEGISGIPLNWQTPLFTPSSLRSRQSILTSADQLFATWSGYYCHEALPSPLHLEQATVSAPGVLRPRGSAILPTYKE